MPNWSPIQAHTTLHFSVYWELAYVSIGSCIHLIHRHKKTPSLIYFIVQVLVQTNDDNLDEEIQTEPIDNHTKWTQCPISFSKSDTDTIGRLKYETSGVGTADMEGETSGSFEYRFLENSAGLGQFIEKFGQVSRSCGFTGDKKEEISSP